MNTQYRDARAKFFLSIICTCFFAMGLGEVTQREFFDINQARDTLFGLSHSVSLGIVALIFGIPFVVSIVLTAKLYKEWKALH